ncbi:MAG: phosphocholine cytidylyltransferase family protein [Candidatus Nanopelagicales bacterium]|jgi:choline kinase|nr:phosphocholine cytidylyltransferase family protein [Candidatus Nanopelagicales bacterium]
MTIQVAILAAGMGTRLGRPWPKPLTKLHDGRSIMGQQRENIATVFGDQAKVITVVGFKLESILEAFPDGLFVYNENFDTTNTSKSLLKALESSAEGPVLWMNGDVVFDPAVLARLESNILRGDNVICVNTATVAEEEVKYTVDDDGYVNQLSKQVQNALGEAVGINLVSAKDKARLVECLVACDEQDYFERGIELAIERHGIKFAPVDISDLFAVEIDFEADLDRVNDART